MAVVATNLTSGGSDVAASSFLTASVTPSANALIILTTNVRHASGTPAVPTASGCGLTWVEVGNVLFDNGTNKKRITVFRAMGTPSAGQITINYGASTESHAGWTVDQYTGVDQSGTNGSGAIVQSNTGSVTSTSLTVTLGAFSNANNITHGSFASGNSGTLANGASFTLLARGSSAGGSSIAEYALSNQTSVDASDSPSTAIGGIVMEIKAGAATATYIGSLLSMFR